MRRKSTRNIPAGGYCYRIIGPVVKGSFPIKLCPYFTRKYDKRYRGKFAYCKYINDFGCGALDDQCKECGIKTDTEEEKKIEAQIEAERNNGNTK